MATCVQSIEIAAETGFSDVPDLVSMTMTPITFDLDSNQLIRVPSAAIQTITFNLSLAQVTTGTVAVTVTIYRLSGTTPVSLGSISVKTLNSSFTKDLLPGDYIMCIRTTNLISYTGTLVGSFVGFPPSIRLAPVFEVGEELRPQLETYPPIRECDAALTYEILEGELPPGIVMTSQGILQGRLPNLDCLEDPEDQYSPSHNWYVTTDTNMSKPIGRQWRFKVRVMIAGIADTEAVQWFCIRVHNNWDLDRDNFLERAPFTSTVTMKVATEARPTLPDTLCPPAPEEPKKFVSAAPLPSMVCAPCDEPTTISRPSVLIPIPEPLRAIPPAMIVQWYEENKDRPPDECCEITKFISDLEASPMFRRLLVQHGLVPGSIGPSARDLVVAAQFGEFLRLTEVEVGVRDIDTLMKAWKDQENSRLPIYLEPETGESLIVTIS